jgi:hypothetical protein
MKRAFLLLLLYVSACAQQTTEISRGSYGPFSIGESKFVSLAKIERLTSVLSVEPIPPIDVQLSEPTLESIHALDASNGILVWLDHQPFPLRIELQNGVVVAKWGADPKCVASSPRMNYSCAELKRLNDAIPVGAHRSYAYKTIVEFVTPLSKQIGVFIVGLQEFRTGANASKQDYRRLILSNDAWKFDGLEDLSKYDKPFYSTVTLYFDHGNLSRIKHFSAKHEAL